MGPEKQEQLKSVEAAISERATASANETVFAGRRVQAKRWVNFVTDNPYYRGDPRHVIWHNAFYAECRRLGRRVI